MKIVLTLEDTADGVALNWTEEQSEFQNHAPSSLAVVIAAQFLAGVRQQWRMGLLKLTGLATQD